MQRRNRLAAGSELFVLVALWLAGAFAVTAAAQQKAEKSNMDLVGSNDLQNRSAYQPVIHKQGARWIAYVGHHGGEAMNPLTGKMEPNGTSIVDVTDPKHPKYLAHIPGEPSGNGGAEAGGAQMVRVCDGSELPRADKSKVYLLRPFGMMAEEIWDVSKPEAPSRRPWWSADCATHTKAGGNATAASPTWSPGRPGGGPSA